MSLITYKYHFIVFKNRIVEHSDFYLNNFIFAI